MTPAKMRDKTPRKDIDSRTRPADAVPLPPLITDVLPLGILALVLAYSNRLFTVVDAEVLSLNREAQGFHALLASWMHVQPLSPLYDAFMYIWLLLTSGVFGMLSVPAIAFFIAGLWVLSRAAMRMGGAPSATALVWLGALWPYGFHFGRLAAGYSFVFLCISALTWAYLRYCEMRTRESWTPVLILAVVLLYATYFGWLVLLCLAVDDFLRHRAESGTVRRWGVSAAVLAVVYTPLWPSLVRTLHQPGPVHSSWRGVGFNLAYDVYVLLVSEAMAPWFWRFAVPAALGVAACFVLVYIGIRPEMRRWMGFGAVLLVVMALTHTLNARTTSLAAPWFLLPIAVAVGTMEAPFLRRGLAAALLVAGGIGWYGITVQRYYAAPRYLEPWPTVAPEAAEALREGVGVIGNNPSFFFYLTYQLQLPASLGLPWHFSGSLPEQVHADGVWDAQQWLAAGSPVRPAMFWVRGIPGPEDATPIVEAARVLDQRCGNRSERLLAHDGGYDWKQRFFPEANELLWRIEIRNYDCSAPVATPAPAPGKPAH